jgi:hypothetical protein
VNEKTSLITLCATPEIVRDKPLKLTQGRVIAFSQIPVSAVIIEVQKLPCPKSSL